MKKIISFVAFIAISAGAFAQNGFLSITSDNEMHSLRFLDHIGIGFTSPMGDNIYTNHTSLTKNNEAFINILTYKFIPSYHSMLSLGVDLDWDRYCLDNDYYFDYQNNKLVVGQTSPIISNLKKNWFDKFSIQLPLDYTLSFGPAALTLGASAEYNLPGYVRLLGDSTAAADKYNKKYSGVKVNPFTANVHAALTILHVGVYARYNPMKVMTEEQGYEFTTWTVGIIIK